MPNPLEHDIAYQLYIGMQASVSAADLERSILSLARMFPTLNPLDYTEDYFVEEMIFVSVLALEAEVRFGFIKWMIDAWEKDRGLARHVVPTDVYRALKEISYPVACERMRLAGLEPAPLDNAAALEGRLFSRFAEYEQLAKDSLACSAPLQKQNWSVGLSRREHPMEKYLGVASDHFCESLAEPVEAIDRSAIEMAVQQKWSITMAGIQRTTGRTWS
jgi:hypothetical protein